MRHLRSSVPEDLYQLQLHLYYQQRCLENQLQPK
jgi:hypothetical protein